MSKKRAPPARRVYYEWEKIQTKPDYKLGEAFEQTQPGVTLPSLAFEEEVTTAEWLLPAIGIFIGGILLGHWWAGRKTKATLAATPGAVVGEEVCELDMLGAM